MRVYTEERTHIHTVFVYQFVLKCMQKTSPVCVDNQLFVVLKDLKHI